ncbi:MAG: hypothetical protein ACK55Z_15320 [bacterium]
MGVFVRGRRKHAPPGVACNIRVDFGVSVETSRLFVSLLDGSLILLPLACHPALTLVSCSIFCT